MKTNPRKRLAINLAAFLIIAAIAVTAALASAPKAADLEKVGLPTLKALKPIPVAGLNLSPKSGVIEIGLEIPQPLDPEAMAADVIEVYRWGRRYFGPYKCGPDYPPGMCLIGKVHIAILVRQDVLGPNGNEEQYAEVIVFELDQIQIDKLLADPPADLNTLGAFHEEVAQGTNNTGGYIQVFTPPTPFEGFK